MSGKILCASIVGGLMAILSQPMSVAAASPSLAGSWQITLTPTTPPIPTVPISGLATFTSDGNAVETDASEVVPSLGSTGALTYGTPGHGVWQTGPAITNLYVQYISVVANADGSLYAKNVTTMMVTLNSNGTRFTGSYTTDQVSASGQTTKVISGTVAGKLIPHLAVP